jgi:hypothetical protein
MIMSRLLNKGVPILIGLLVVVDGAMILRYRTAIAAHSAQDSALLYRSPGERGLIPFPDGYTAKGEKINIVLHSQAGWAVRYAAKGCLYCRNDKQWGVLSNELQRRGYQVIVVTSSAREAYPEGDLVPRGAAQEAFVRMEWIKRFRLVGTPTLLIFGPDQRLIWSHQGMLSADDQQSAVRAIKGAGEKSK